jgi:DNA modification methylase
MGRHTIGDHPMSPAERQRRWRATLARETATLPINQVLVGHAAEVMTSWPSNSIDLIVTSPPYWNAVVYDGQMPPWPSYQAYLDDLLTVWVECARVLRPAGKLCINAPLLPVEQKRMKQDTRVLKDIAGDIGRGILAETDLLRLCDQFIWQKQTTERMLGVYPYPGHNYANNTVEFITVYVKPGKNRVAATVKAANRMSDKLHLNLTQQVWFMMPAKINRDRAKDHPSPFPELLPARLIRLYTFGAVQAAGFPGEIVVDPFCGTGTTSVAAKRMGRRWIGIDLVGKYAEMARERVARAAVDGGPILLVSSPKQQSRSTLEATWKSLAGQRNFAGA